MVRDRIVALASAIVGSVLMLGATPSQPVCEYQVSPVRIELSDAPQSGVIAIQTGPGCAWTAASGGSISIGASAGTGPAQLAYSVSRFTEDPYYTPIRQGVIQIRWNTPTAGQNVYITQSKGPCDRLFPYPSPGRNPSETFGPGGGTGAFEVLAGDGFSYPWRINETSDWITVTRPPLGIVRSGDGGFGFIAAPNPSLSPRDGYILTCNGRPIAVHQAGRSARGGPYVPADLDDDGIADLVVFRPGLGVYYALKSATGYTQYQSFLWGPAGRVTVPVPADFDGDNKMDVVNVDPSRSSWKTLYSSNGYRAETATNLGYFGITPEDRPVLADFNGDAKSDFAQYRPSTGEWFVRVSDTRTPQPIAERTQWGLPGDVPVPADFDGDRQTDLAVWRPSTGTWYIRLSSEAYAVQSARTIQWGLQDDIPVPGDFDGDGHADLAVWRPSTGTWYVVFASSNYVGASFSVQWGLSGDIPVANDYDGDGRLDFAIWRPSDGTWYLLLSSGQYRYANAKSYQWGWPGDIPVAPRLSDRQQ
jgi:FG-GAP-like repeat